MLQYTHNIKRRTYIQKQIIFLIQNLNMMEFIVSIGSRNALKPTGTKSYFGPMLKLYLHQM